MTFAIVRKGVIVDHVRVDTLEALAGWLRGRQDKGTELVMVDQPVRTGARVVVKRLWVQLASLAGPRPGCGG